MDKFTYFKEGLLDYIHPVGTGSLGGDLTRFSGVVWATGVAAYSSGYFAQGILSGDIKNVGIGFAMGLAGIVSGWVGGALFGSALDKVSDNDFYEIESRREREEAWIFDRSFPFDDYDFDED